MGRCSARSCGSSRRGACILQATALRRGRHRGRAERCSSCSGRPRTYGSTRMCMRCSSTAPTTKAPEARWSFSRDKEPCALTAPEDEESVALAEARRVCRRRQARRGERGALPALTHERDVRHRRFPSRSCRPVRRPPARRPASGRSSSRDPRPRPRGLSDELACCRARAARPVPPRHPPNHLLSRLRVRYNDLIVA